MSENSMNMIEKVARAIATADEQNGGPPYEMLMTMGKHVRNDLYDRAKAAIEAMREPTDLMVLPEGYRSGSHSASQIWRCMIDSALDGK